MSEWTDEHRAAHAQGMRFWWARRRREREAAKPVSGWQPIGTAPLQRYVLIWQWDGCVVIAARHPKRGWQSDNPRGDRIKPPPPHWMHLPKAPE